MRARHNLPTTSVVEVVKRHDGHWYRNTLGHLIGPYSTQKRALGEGAMALARALHPNAPQSELARIAQGLLAEDRSRPFVRRFVDGWRVWNPRTGSFVGNGPGGPFSTRGEAEHRRRALVGEATDDGPMFRRLEAASPPRAAPQLDLFGARKNPGRPVALGDAGLATVSYGGARFETGRPVTFDFARNTAKAPRIRGGAYAQDVEPAGVYMIQRETDVMPPGWVSGAVTFRSPLVLWLDTDGDYAGPGGWKRRLSRAFGGKRGAALSRAIVGAGHDGIVTVAERHGQRHTMEIVDLSPFVGPRRNPTDRVAPAKVRAQLHEGLRLVAEGRAGKGLRGQTVREAERMAAGDPVPNDKVRRMVAWFRRHRVDKRPGWAERRTPGYVAWLLWGGDEGWAWAERERSALVRKGVLPPLQAVPRSNPGIFSPLRNTHGEAVTYEPEGEDTVVVRFSTPGVGVSDREMGREQAIAHRAKMLRMGYRPNPATRQT